MRILKDKKGVGMELAIFMLVIVFAFCSLITTIAYSVSINKTREVFYTKTKVTLDRIGEEFLSFSAGNTVEFNSVPEEYGYEIKDVGTNKELSVTQEGVQIFVVLVDENNNVLRWQYLF